MSADKRSVHTDALETLGTIIGEGEGRDAIHLAVEPVEAAERLYPGQDVRLNDEKKAVSATHVDGIGIVDPFLRSPVYIGQKFWLVVYPRQITSLRHVWTHPAFDPLPQDLPCSTVSEPERPDVAASKEWIANYAKSLSGEDWGWDDKIYVEVTYDDLVETAKTWVDSKSRWGGEYLSKGGLLEGVGTDPEFWHHFEVVTGLTVPEDNKGNFFSCSC